jgi:hypothetical protein
VSYTSSRLRRFCPVAGFLAFVIEQDKNMQMRANRSSEVPNQQATKPLRFKKEGWQLGLMSNRVDKILLSSGRAWFSREISDLALEELVSSHSFFPNIILMSHTDLALLQPIIAKPRIPATGFGEIIRGNFYLKEGRQA